MNKITFYQQLIIPISQWTMFACGLKLYVIGISSLLAVLLWWLFVLKTGLWRVLYNLLKEEVTETIIDNLAHTKNNKNFVQIIKKVFMNA